MYDAIMLVLNWDSTIIPCRAWHGCGVLIKTRIPNRY